MKGFVPTPAPIVDLMIDKLFRDQPPEPAARVLDAGCGPGAFIDGVLRWCTQNNCPIPVIVGVDSDPIHAETARHRFSGMPQIEIRRSEFLRPSVERFDYIMGNPPYVPITGLSDVERATYRATYGTAKGRFDLYLLFFEQALGQLTPGGRLVFITPDKFLYVDTARPLRAIMHQMRIEELHFLDEQSFGGLVTYPLVSTLSARPGSLPTRIVHRDGRTTSVLLDGGASSWLPPILGADEPTAGMTLGDICTRISCGVATGADSVFAVRDADVDPQLRGFTLPTIAGRQIISGRPLRTMHSLLLSYAADGQRLPETELGALGQYLLDPVRRQRLLARTCVLRKPWYAYHETPPLAHIRRPKILCKDITATPFFIADPEGRIVPRHSAYYIVPADPSCLDDLVQYLNSAPARDWLRLHCQRAANGFLRVQSHALKRLPVPPRFGVSADITLDGKDVLEAQVA